MRSLAAIWLAFDARPSTGDGVNAAHVGMVWSLELIDRFRSKRHIIKS